MGVLCDGLEGRGQLANPPPWLSEWLGGGATSATGLPITEKNALEYTPFWAAVGIIAGGVGTLPFMLYERLQDGGKARAPGHRAHTLMHDRPNPYMDALTFRETLTAHTLAWGNGYAEIQRDGAARPVALWPLMPNRVTPKVSGGKRIYYEVTKPAGGMVRLPYENVLHIKGLGFDGLKGYSVVRYHAEAIGLGKATEKFGAAFFGHGSVPGGVIEHPNQYGDTAVKHLRESWEEKHKGLDQAHRVAILEEGAKWKAIGIPAKDAQLIETKNFSVRDVARIFQIPPHMLADLERATFSNIEHQGMAFVTMTLLKWLRRWEMETNWKLLNPDERRKYFAEFLVEGFLRGDTATRYKAYAVGRQWGWLSANDIRRLENMNSRPGGDAYLVPLNMVSVQGVPGAGPGRALQAVAASFEAVLAEDLERMLRKEANDGRRAMNRSPETFRVWWEKYYADYGRTLQGAIAQTVQSAAAALWEVGLGMPAAVDGLRAAEEATAAAVNGHVADSRGVLAGDGGPEALTADAERPKREARRVIEGLTEQIEAQREERNHALCERTCGEAEEAGGL